MTGFESILGDVFNVIQVGGNTKKNAAMTQSPDGLRCVCLLEPAVHWPLQCLHWMHPYNGACLVHKCIGTHECVKACEVAVP